MIADVTYFNLMNIPYVSYRDDFSFMFVGVPSNIGNMDFIIAKSGQLSWSRHRKKFERVYDILQAKQDFELIHSIPLPDGSNAEIWQKTENKVNNPLTNQREI